VPIKHSTIIKPSSTKTIVKFSYENSNYSSSVALEYYEEESNIKELIIWLSKDYVL